MALDFPPCFADCQSGQRLSMVAKLQCWDFDQEAHLMETVHAGIPFLATGLLDGVGECFSLVNAEFRKQFPIPVIAIDSFTKVLRHDRPSWTSLHDVVELCSGFGGMHQGLCAMGFRTVAAVDCNERFLDLYAKQGDAARIVGDVNDVSTLMKIWQVSKGACTIAAGFACQPFSRLGDQLGGLDSRAMCLRGILVSAFLLQANAVIPECVQPAAENSFVTNEIRRFLEVSGYHCSQCDLSLLDVWPARRNRAWWLITSPLLGKIPLHAWPKLQIATKVRQLIPALQPWDANDEDELSLSDVEKSAFGVLNDSFHRYLLNFEASAPCALHSWGSQMIGCKCGCRQSGLSEKRLRDKGLFGCIVYSCGTDSKQSLIRHVHPNEVMMMCGFDPLYDFGPNPRLTLAAAGQMASPIQTAWVFATLDERIQQLHGTPSQFQADAQVTAFCTWLLMRSRQVWPADVEPIEAKNIASLLGFWDEVSSLSMPELMFPGRWPMLGDHQISIASVLDLLIRKHQAVTSPPICKGISAGDDVAMTAMDDDGNEFEPTPWHEGDSPIDEMVLPCCSQEGCVVVFLHEFANPLECRVSLGVTIQQLIHAQCQLVGPFQVTRICDHLGTPLSQEHVLAAGQIVLLHCEFESHEPTILPAPPASDASVVPVSPSNVGDEPVPHVQPCPVPGHEVSPTVAWTHPICDDDSIEPGSFGPFDAGQCDVPVIRLPDCESWVSAAPLLGLKGQQFLKLHVPVVQSTTQLWSLKHQFLQAADRSAILTLQEAVWSDDEIRHHIGLLLEIRNAKRFSGIQASDRDCIMLDPLLLTGWVQHGTNLCHLWAHTHPEIRNEGKIVLSACAVDGHWVPVVFSPSGNVLHVTTWDAPCHSHVKLDGVIGALGKLLGFDEVSILRHQRMFFTTDKCGALAIAFLHHSVLGSMLPSNGDEADLLHGSLRTTYQNAVESCQIARRPWIWGMGDKDPEKFWNEPGVSSSDTPCPVQPSIADSSHQCIDKDQRIDLLVQKGKMWGDDEIRFHLTHMLMHPNNVANLPYSVIPGFVMLDPLILTTWDTIGQTLCEAWCRRHMVVSDSGFHVVAAFVHNEHWFPFWVVPHGRTIVAHVIEDGVVDFQVVMPLLAVLKEQFGFHEMVLNKHPNRLPEHSLCGAATVAFLGHIMVSAELPDDLEALRDYHANMKASFVQAIHAGQCCICPVAWGAGSVPSLTKQLAEELSKHGVPDECIEQRANQAIKALGAEQVQKALSSRNVWRSLKAIGNNAKFQFLLPEELSVLVASNKSLPTGRRAKLPQINSRPSVPVVVDPSKLSIPDGVFHDK